MKKTTLLNLLLAAALLFVTIQLIQQKTADTSGNATDEISLYDGIMNRTSIRKFTPQEVSDQAVDSLLRAAMAAPTARNCQPWHFVVVTDTAQLHALAATSRHAGPLNTAHLAIAVCGDMSKAMDGEGQSYWIQDASAATENMLLAAHALGLGAVWTGVYPIEERVNAVSQVLQLPKKIIPLAVVVIGYPDEQPTPKDKWKDANVSYDTYEGE